MKFHDEKTPVIENAIFEGDSFHLTEKERKKMNIRDEVAKALDALPEEALEGVLEYIQFISGPPEAEPTEEERKALKRGREEFDRGEFFDWEDVRGK